MSQELERGLQEVNDVLKLAKLTEDEILANSQAIYFTKSDFYDNDYKLIQLDQHLKDEIKEGNTLYIKGNDNEEVVICSDVRTYNVTEAETSNSLLLVQDLKFSDSLQSLNQREISKKYVSAIFYDYLEATLGKPRLKLLPELLKDTVYKGPEHEFEIKTEMLWSFEDLNNRVQSSEKELRDALKEMDVIIIDDKVRLLDFAYHFRVLSFMLKLIEENSWELDHIIFEETLDALISLVPRQILITLFDKYTEESKVIDGIQLYRYKEVDVCRFFAQVILHSGRIGLNEFMETWKVSLPEGIIPTEEMLHGIALIDHKSTEKYVLAYPEDSLPDNITDRLKALFEVREKWSVPEISPYIERLATEKMDVNALLAKHARASKMDGVKYYSSKHGK